MGEMPDDVLLLIIAKCGERYVALPELEAVNALGCLCRSVAEQLCWVQPVVGVQVRSLVIAPRLAARIAMRWRIMLLYQGELTAAVVEQGFIGRVRAIDARGTKRLNPTVAKRVVPGLLAAGSSQFELEMSHVELNGTWESIFGEMAVASDVLCGLQLCGCRLRGPLPELRLPALQVLGLNANQLTGGLGPIRGCTALQKIFIAGNQLTGDLSALASCKNLKKVFLYNNQLSGGLEPLRDCVAIEELFLAGNQLSGDLLSQQVRPGASIPEAQGSLPRAPTHRTHGYARTQPRACRALEQLVSCGAPQATLSRSDAARSSRSCTSRTTRCQT